MKKIILTLASLLLIAPSAHLMADDDDRMGAYLTLGHNWFDKAKKSSIGDDNAFYATFGVQATEHLAFEFKFSDYEATYLNASILYRLKPKRENSLFWKAGIGHYGGIPEGGQNINLGAGYETHIDDKMSFVFGLDSVYQESIEVFDWVPYVGLTYHFGSGSKKSSPAAKPEPAPVLDADNDGVIDSLDQCPDSVAGAIVDSNGCELDGDNDGVVDRLDSCLETPAGAKVDNKGCRIILTEDVSIKLHVQFATNSDLVTDTYRSDVKRVADFMREYPDTTVVIEGHTDSMGKASYNKALSKKRATAVMQYLVSTFGIDPARVAAEGKGEESPVADNATKEGRATNRRVQAEIKTSVSKPQ